MRTRLASHQPRSLRDERTCDHHFGLALEIDPQARIADQPACTSPMRAIVLDFLPGTLVACDDAISYLRADEKVGA